jgi:rod shape-determining protein MreD
MKELAWIFSAYVAMALLSPLLGRLDSQVYAPDVALLTALYAGSRSRGEAAVLCGFAIGLLKDGFSLSAPVGIYTEICTLTVYMTGFLQTRVDLFSPVPLMATAAGWSLVSTGLFLIGEAVFHRTFSGYAEVLTTAMPLALTTMLLAPVWFGLLDRWTSRLEPRHKGSALLRSR